MTEFDKNVGATEASDFHPESELLSEPVVPEDVTKSPKRRKTLTERRDALLEKRAALDDRMKKLKAQEKQLQGKISAQKRRENDHRKIVIGGYVEAALGHQLSLAAPDTPGASKRLSPESAAELAQALNHGIATGASEEENRRSAVSRAIDVELGRDVSADEAAGLVRGAIATARIHEEAAHDPSAALTPEVAARLTDAQKEIVQAVAIGTKVQNGLLSDDGDWTAFKEAVDRIKREPLEEIENTGLTDEQTELLRLVQIALILETRSGVKIRKLDGFGEYCGQYARALSAFSLPTREDVLSMFSVQT